MKEVAYWREEFPKGEWDEKRVDPQHFDLWYLTKLPDQTPSYVARPCLSPDPNSPLSKGAPTAEEIGAVFDIVGDHVKMPNYRLYHRSGNERPLWSTCEFVDGVQLTDQWNRPYPRLKSIGNKEEIIVGLAKGISEIVEEGLPVPYDIAKWKQFLGDRSDEGVLVDTDDRFYKEYDNEKAEEQRLKLDIMAHDAGIRGPRRWLLSREIGRLLADK